MGLPYGCPCFIWRLDGSEVQLASKSARSLFSAAILSLYQDESQRPFCIQASESERRMVCRGCGCYGEGIGAKLLGIKVALRNSEETTLPHQTADMTTERAEASTVDSSGVAKIHTEADERDREFFSFSNLVRSDAVLCPGQAMY